MFDLTGKGALVTGASGGIGGAIARALHAQGAAVVLSGTRTGPLEALGMGADIGSLRAGRRADVVLWDGDPLEVGSAPAKVFISGVEQSLESHQSGLRQRYRDLDESARPKAFDW